MKHRQYFRVRYQRQCRARFTPFRNTVDAVYASIGAYVDEGMMVDTAPSRAQIGKNVQPSGARGGVLAAAG